jgi:hypothetical protein
VVQEFSQMVYTHPERLQKKGDRNNWRMNYSHWKSIYCQARSNQNGKPTTTTTNNCWIWISETRDRNTFYLLTTYLLLTCYDQLVLNLNLSDCVSKATTRRPRRCWSKAW